MERRGFIKTIIASSGVILLPIGLSACGKKNIRTISFGISTDIHQDIMHDAGWRLQQFLDVAKKQNLDFVIDLGDFCFPKKENIDFLNIWRTSKIEKYNVLGNHDMDTGTKEDFMNFVGMPKRYYSFDRGEFHFIVLDPNNLHIDGNYIPYEFGNFYKPMEQRGYVDPEQLEWLKIDLAKTDKHTIIFSHQSLENKKACQNQEEVRIILEETNRKVGFQKVIAAFSGHDHTDYASEINGIQYIQINSMSNQWVGKKYQCPERFSNEINKKRPSLKYTIPYKDPLFAIVSINQDELIIEGVQSSFIEPGPIVLGIDTSNMDLPLKPSISNREFLID